MRLPVAARPASMVVCATPPASPTDRQMIGHDADVDEDYVPIMCKSCGEEIRPMAFHSPLRPWPPIDPVTGEGGPPVTMRCVNEGCSAYLEPTE